MSRPAPQPHPHPIHEVFSDGAIAVEMIVSLPRVDDHVRVFQHLRYQVKRPVNFSRLAFFQLGADYYDGNTFDRLAIGNADGLIKEWSPGQGSWRYERQDVLLRGPPPGCPPMPSMAIRPRAMASGHPRLDRAFVESPPRRPGLPARAAGRLLTEWGKGNYRTTLELAARRACVDWTRRFRRGGY